MKSILNQIYVGANNRPSLYDVFYEEREKNQPVIIFSHGFKGFKDWGCFNLMAAFLAKHGFVCVKYNFSHNGGTVDEPIDFPDLEAFGTNNFTKELYDLEVIIDTVLSGDIPQADPNQIWLMGHSRGGGISILKAMENPHIQGVIGLASVSDCIHRFGGEEMEKTWKEKGVIMTLNGRTQQQMPLYYQLYEDLINHKEQLDILSRLKTFTKPFCIIHGEEDSSVPIEEAYAMKKAQPNAQLNIIEKANHTFNASHPWIKDTMPKELIQALEVAVDCINHNT